jgi:hypothetical protein
MFTFVYFILFDIFPSLFLVEHDSKPKFSHDKQDPKLLPYTSSLELDALSIHNKLFQGRFGRLEDCLVGNEILSQVN